MTENTSKGDELSFFADKTALLRSGVRSVGYSFLKKFSCPHLACQIQTVLAHNQDAAKNSNSLDHRSILRNADKGISHARDQLSKRNS